MFEAWQYCDVCACGGGNYCTVCGVCRKFCDMYDVVVSYCDVCGVRWKYCDVHGVWGRYRV